MMNDMDVSNFKERFIKLEAAVEAQGILLEKLNLIIVGNGKKGLAEIARDLNQISESLDKRIARIELCHEEERKESKDKLLKKEEDRRNDIKKIILGVILTLTLSAISGIANHPEILTVIFGGN